VIPEDARQATNWRRVQRRHLTPAGNVVALGLATGATTVLVTFPRAEVDTAYGVLVTPSWNTTVWVTGKTTTGCTVNAGTAAPAGGTVDLLTFRSE